MHRLLFITYHYVRPEDLYPFPGIHSISLKRFEKQVDAIQKKYYLPTAKEVEDHLYGKKELKDDSIFFTFDDGLPEHFSVAIELLASKNIAAAFFITSRPYIEKKALAVHKVHWLRANIHPDEFSSFLFNELHLKIEDLYSMIAVEDACRTYPYDNERNAILKFYINFKLSYKSLDKITSKMLSKSYGDEELFCKEFYLSTNQIKTIKQAGHIVGSHSHCHQPWSRMSEAELEQDLMQNINFLSDIVGKRPEWVSYPYGRDWAIPKNTEDICNKFGFKLAFTLNNGWNNEGQDTSRVLRINYNELEEYTGIS